MAITNEKLMKTKQHAYIGKIYGGNISSQINQQAYNIHTCGSISPAKAHKTLGFLHKNPSAFLPSSPLWIPLRPPLLFSKLQSPGSPRNPQAPLLSILLLCLSSILPVCVFLSKSLLAFLFMHQQAWACNPPYSWFPGRREKGGPTYLSCYPAPLMLSKKLRSLTPQMGVYRPVNGFYLFS